MDEAHSPRIEGLSFRFFRLFSLRADATFIRDIHGGIDRSELQKTSFRAMAKVRLLPASNPLDISILQSIGEDCVDKILFLNDGIPQVTDICASSDIVLTISLLEDYPALTAIAVLAPVSVYVLYRAARSRSRKLLDRSPLS